MEEIWKDIQGQEGCYQVSNIGRIKSLSRYKTPEEANAAYVNFLKINGHPFKYAEAV